MTPRNADFMKARNADFMKARDATYVKSRDAGFTLLEVLVALVVFGLVMVGIAQTFHFGLTAWSVATRNTAAPEDMASMDVALTSIIAQTIPGSMTGRPDGMAFTTRLPAGAGLSGLADAAIQRSPDGTLILRYGVHPPGIPLSPTPAPKTEPLTANVKALTLAYLAPQANGSPTWSNNWSGRGLPLLVRLHLEFANAKPWPDLVVAPVNQGD